jgi:transcriptional regulator with GAF, ATPase, and Fis domain
MIWPGGVQAVANDHHTPELMRTALTAVTFVEIFDALVDDFDVVDLLTNLTDRCVQILEVSAAGILLVADSGDLRVMAASDERAQLLELIQIQNDQGPCLDCFTTGSVVQCADLRTSPPWPQFAARSVQAGMFGVCAIPLRLKERVLGCLNLFLSEPGLLSEADVELARSLAHVASIAIVQDQFTRLAALWEGQLKHALNSRVAIEQAKGMIAERSNVDMEVAFARLRAFSRNNNRAISEVAASLVSGALEVDVLLKPRPVRSDTSRPTA